MDIFSTQAYIESLPQAAERTPEVEKKPAGKKESADSSGSSLLEFAFQSALFGNTLFGDKEASPTPPPGLFESTPFPENSDKLLKLFNGLTRI